MHRMRPRECVRSSWRLLLFFLSSSSALNTIGFGALQGKRVLVVGGSGRVGGSVTTQLVQRGCTVTVGGTNAANFQSAQQRWLNVFPNHITQLQQVAFAVVDKEISKSVENLLQHQGSAAFDLVIHVAGPFQGKVAVPNGVLQACLMHAVPYMDVCDDYCTATAAKTKYASWAQEQNVPCIVSTGCWPGVSSLMAKQLVTATLERHPNITTTDLSIDFSFFTAGSGGAGVTLLVATFLILSEKALTIVNGRRKAVDAMADYSTVNFGNIIGDRDVAPLNLLETASVHDVLGVGSTRSRFGTAPTFWNSLLGLMAKLPPELLANEDIMRKLSVFSIPIVRVVDFFAGASNAMRCDVTSARIADLQVTAIYGHENLEPCVGECVTAFACAILSGAVPAGIWFPEEAIEAGIDAAQVLALASVGAHTTDVATNGCLKLTEEFVWGTRLQSCASEDGR